MGSWFSNLSVKKNGAVTEDGIAAYIGQWMAGQQYAAVGAAEEADASFAIVSPGDASWVTVYGDNLSFEDPKAFGALAASMSEALGSDVLRIACFDSDYLYLNLIDAAGGVNAWAGVGSAAGLGIKRRTNLSAWKKKIGDFARFQERVRQESVFAEDVLQEVAPCLGLSAEYAALSYEYLEELAPGESVRYLHFKLPDSGKTEEPPRLAWRSGPFFCEMEQWAYMSFLNVGGASKGLSVYFLGDYVEAEEITFSDVCWVREKKDSTERTPIELQKIRLPDGRWAYYYHDPGYRIPPKADDRLPPAKKWRIESKREIRLGFTPHGNRRKSLEITVVLVPDKNPEGQCGWNALQFAGTKERFIEDYNKWHGSKAGFPPLREEDFD